MNELLADLRAQLENALEAIRRLQLAQKCADCGRSARELTPWFEDVDGVNQITAYLGPTCYRRRLDALQAEATGGHICQPFPIGGAA